MARSNDALELLHRDHEEVQKLFKRAQRTEGREKQQIAREIVQRLETHTMLEEQVFYPYLRETTGRADVIEEADIEHETAKNLLDELQGAELGSPRFDALLNVLAEYVEHHVEEEEGTIFPLARKTGVDLEALGAELMDRRRGGGEDGQGGGKTNGGAHPGDGRPRRGKEDTGTAGRAGTARGAGDMHREDEKFLREHGDELSRSTQRARWIHSVGEHEEHPGQTLATRNPDVIRRWAEERDARPATTANGDPERPRVLRFDFGDRESGLQEVSWEAWLRVFDERELVFLYQERMKAGNQSNFFRLDSPQREDG